MKKLFTILVFVVISLNINAQINTIANETIVGKWKAVENTSTPFDYIFTSDKMIILPTGKQIAYSINGDKLMLSDGTKLQIQQIANEQLTIVKNIGLATQSSALVFVRVD